MPTRTPTHPSLELPWMKVNASRVIRRTMVRESNLRSALPELRQQPLVAACLDPDPVRAKAAGVAWLESTPLESADAASLRLVPLLYWRLATAGVSHPMILPLKAHYRRHWASNQVSLRQCAQVVEYLESAGIPVIILKGLPLAFSVYPDPGTRPMGDIDLLVPSALAEAAMDRLTALGAIRKSSPPPALPGWPPGAVLRLQHAAHFELPDGAPIDLHWFSLEECCGADADHGFWTRRVSWTAESIRLNTLSPADQLLHLCVHGLRADRRESSMRWLVDVVLLLRAHSATLDWATLLAEARCRRVSHSLAEALSIVMATGYAKVPSEIVPRLREQVSTRWERWAHQSNVSTLPRHKFATLWLRYVRSTPGESTWHRLRGFLRYLQGRWSAASFSALVAHATRQALRSRPAPPEKP